MDQEAFQRLVTLIFVQKEVYKKIRFKIKICIRPLDNHYAIGKATVGFCDNKQAFIRGRFIKAKRSQTLRTPGALPEFVVGKDANGHETILQAEACYPYWFSGVSFSVARERRWGRDKPDDQINHGLNILSRLSFSSREHVCVFDHTISLASAITLVRSTWAASSIDVV
jgi:hypothetical protein